VHSRSCRVRRSCSVARDFGLVLAGAMPRSRVRFLPATVQSRPSLAAWRETWVSYSPAQCRPHPCRCAGKDGKHGPQCSEGRLLHCDPRRERKCAASLKMLTVGDRRCDNDGGHGLASRVAALFWCFFCQWWRDTSHWSTVHF
jgi:hypothetical protein